VIALVNASLFTTLAASASGQISGDGMDMSGPSQSGQTMPGMAA
jgi:hypothetical protein